MVPEHDKRPEVHDRHGEPVGQRIRETGTGAANRRMWTGAVLRALIWGVLGALLGLAFALVPWGGPFWIRLLGFGICGFLGGSAAGFVYGAGRHRDLDVEAHDETTFAPLDTDHHDTDTASR